MKTQLENRLKQLESEMKTGEEQLQQIEEKKATLERTILRISGAIQVLKEELEKADEEEVNTMQALESESAA